jgi:hypothetical protein
MHTVVQCKGLFRLNTSVASGFKVWLLHSFYKLLSVAGGGGGGFKVLQFEAGNMSETSALYRNQRCYSDWGGRQGARADC